VLQRWPCFHDSVAHGLYGDGVNTVPPSRAFSGRRERAEEGGERGDEPFPPPTASRRWGEAPATRWEEGRGLSAALGSTRLRRRKLGGPSARGPGAAIGPRRSAAPRAVAPSTRRPSASGCSGAASGGAVNRRRGGGDAGPPARGDGKLSKATTERPDSTATAEPRVRAPHGDGEAPAALAEGCAWGRRWR
jgi:hypothetical protein